MTTAIKRRRGTTAQHSTFTGLEGEITVDTTKDTLVVHDGSTAGGFALLREDLSNNTNVASTSTTQTFTNKTFGDNPTFSAGAANGVAYLNGSKVLTTGSALTFDGTKFTQTASTSGLLSEFKNSLSTNQNGNIAVTNDAGTAMRFQVYGSAAGSYGMLSAGNPSIYTSASELNLVADNASGVIKFGLNSAAEQMRLTSTGLGIGTSSPGYKLDVFSAGGYIAHFGANTTSIGIQGDTFVFGNANLSAYGTGNYDASTHVFKITNTERMRIDSSGNLGLGVTPSGWSGMPAIILAKGSGSGTYPFITGNAVGNDTAVIGTNAYYNGGWKYQYSGSIPAMKYEVQYNQHAWYTAPSGTAGNAISFTQAMTLDASGNLLVGKTTTTSVDVGVVANPSGQVYCTANGTYAGLFNRTTSDGEVVQLRRSNAVVGTISVTSSATAYNTSSDYRLKENIQPMQNALGVVQQLNPVTYTWKADGSDGQGFIAHELQAVVPDCVTGEKDAVDAEGKPVYQGIDTSFLVATLTKAIQELKAELDATKAEVAALKGA